jgi:predicted TPR repeat methyltransferase
MDKKSVQQDLKEAAQHQLADRFPQAEAALQRALTAAPNNSDAWHLRGVLSLQQGDYPAAVQFLRKAISFNPTHPDYLYNLAGAYFMLEQWSDAVKSYQATLQLNPAFAEAYKGLGAALKKLERFREASEAFQRSLELNPAQFPVYLDLADSLEADNRLSYAVQTVQLALKLEPYSPEAHERLASLYRKLGDHFNGATAYYNLGVARQKQKADEAAIEAFREAIQLNPTHPKALYTLASLTGQTPSTAPSEYVVDLFDGYAERFDQHLLELKYEVPALLKEAVEGQLNSTERVEHILDLGCGTGKCGELFRARATQLSGIDLSPKMVESKRRRGLYDEVHLGDIVEFLKNSSTPYDGIVAADVFIYVGDLEAVFREISRRTHRGSWFAFSTESYELPGFVLRPSGRFAHADAYIAELARRFQFSVEHQAPATIRLHEQTPIPGSIFVLQRI